jgi:hypothetical protein
MADEALYFDEEGNLLGEATSLVVSKCTDTDGGNVPNVKGTLTFKSKSYQDVCTSGTIVGEYFCASATQATKAEVACPNGCSNGACITPPVATCSDGIKNQGETDVDCGGPCVACAPVATCSDGIQNQGETGVDCGGPCAACAPVATCSDGVQNQNEQGIDCGGSCALTCFVDYIVQSGSASVLSVAPNGTVTYQFDAVVKNQGNKAATANSFLEAGFSATFLVPALAPGATFSLQSATVNLNSCVSAIILKADRFSQVVESLENNNQLNIQVSNQNDCKPDFVVAAATIERLSKGPGNTSDIFAYTYRVSGTLLNQGSSTSSGASLFTPDLSSSNLFVASVNGPLSSGIGQQFSSEITAMSTFEACGPQGTIKVSDFGDLNPSNNALSVAITGIDC